MPKVYAIFSMGSGPVSNNHIRKMGWGVPEHGWMWCYTKFMQPLAQQGVKRLWLHNPHGTRILPGVEVQMQLDQLTRAREMDFKRAYEEFPAVLEQARKDFEQVVVYYGSPNPHESFFGRIEKIENLKLRDQVWQVYADLNIKPAVDAGCDIGLDASSSIKPGEGFYSLWERLKKRGIRVYIEAIPTKDCPHLLHEPWCIATDFLQRGDAMPQWMQSFAFPFDQLTGECVVISNNLYKNPLDWNSPSGWPPEGETWQTAHTPTGGWMTNFWLDHLRKNRSITLTNDFFRQVKTNIKEYFTQFGVDVD